MQVLGASTCGVSMPTWTTGAARGHVGVRVRQPLAEAGPRAARRRVQPASAASISSARDGVGEVTRQGEQAVAPARTPSRQAASVSSRAAAARSAAAASMPTSAPSRVFTRPGTGAFATTSALATRHASTRQKSRAARAVPRTEPDTFDRVPAARGW